MSDIEKLLPDNSQTFEKGLANAFTSELPVQIRQALVDLSVPEIYDHLAVQESVPIWYRDWPNERKKLLLENALRIQMMRGTRASLLELLTYVDAELIDAVTYPSSFVFGRSRVGRDPLYIRPFRARYLIKIAVPESPRALRIGLSPLNSKTIIKSPSRTSVERATQATIASKTPETEYLTNFAHRRRATFADLSTFADWTSFLRTFVDRTQLRQPL